MTNYAIIENEIVVNIVVSDEDHANAQGWVLLTDGAGIGWSYIDGKFIDKRPVIEPPVVNITQPTKEELLIQLEKLTKQIQALE